MGLRLNFQYKEKVDEDYFENFDKKLKKQGLIK